MKKLMTGFLAALALGGGAMAAVHPDKPNVLFLIADDLRPDYARFGGAEVKSPHLDRLGSEGLVFSRVLPPAHAPDRPEKILGHV